MKAIRTFLLLFFLTSINLTYTYGQRNIKGRVIDEYLEGIIGVQIIDNNNNTGLASTDLNGFFDIVIPNETNKLSFISLGCEFVNIEISDSCDYVEVILLGDISPLGFTPSDREMDRRRKKKFNKLAQLHLNAVEKGIFTSETICYSRKFESLRLKRKAKEKQVKKDYRELSIGDTIQIPFCIYKIITHNGDTSLSLQPCSTNSEPFNCIVDIVEGVVIKKNKERYKILIDSHVGRGINYSFIYRVTKFENFKYDSILYDNKAINIGQEFKYDMRYYNKIIKK